MILSLSSRQSKSPSRTASHHEVRAIRGQSPSDHDLRLPDGSPFCPWQRRPRSISRRIVSVMKPVVQPSLVVNFTDPQLQRCYESNFAEAHGFSNDLRQVCALIGAHDFFQMLEGNHSSRVHETREQLLLPELRAGLRRWYQRSGADKDQEAVALRDQLSQLAGEKLERIADNPHHPS